MSNEKRPTLQQRLRHAGGHLDHEAAKRIDLLERLLRRARPAVYGPDIPEEQRHLLAYEIVEALVGKPVDN